MNTYLKDASRSITYYQCKLGQLKSQQKFSKKEEQIIKNWMTEKRVNQDDLEKGRNNNDQIKRSTQYRTFNR